MERRELLAGLAASALIGTEARSSPVSNTFLEIKAWRLHNTAEGQPSRMSEFLAGGLAPALTRSGATLAGAFSTTIGPDSPCFYTLAKYDSLGAIEDSLVKLNADADYQTQLEKLGSGIGLPFVRVESSVLRSFDVMPEPVIPADAGKRPPRIFELRTYESQTFLTLKRKVGMFNHGEAQIFERLGLRPIFFAETIIGPRQPNLMYMLSYDDLAARDRLWHDFGADPEWKKLRTTHGLTDPEIVANISNVILQPLPFSPIR